MKTKCILSPVTLNYGPTFSTATNMKQSSILAWSLASRILDWYIIWILFSRKSFQISKNGAFFWKQVFCFLYSIKHAPLSAFISPVNWNLKLRVRVEMLWRNRQKYSCIHFEKQFFTFSKKHFWRCLSGWTSLKLRMNSLSVPLSNRTWTSLIHYFLGVFQWN